jgi:uroporphyrinogen-III decarboxylase
MAKLKLSPKDNFLKLCAGEVPDYIPNWTMGGIWPPSGKPTDRPPALMAGPAIGMAGPPPEAEDAAAPAMPMTPPTEYTDMWGVTYQANAETNWQAVPKPGLFILDDATKWDKVVKKPVVPGPETMDWVTMAREGTKHIDRQNIGVISMIGNGPFQALVGFMGFTEGLIALLEEPEAVKEMLNWMADFYEPWILPTLDHYKPDLIYLLDDTASKYAPFFSLEVFKDIFKPIYARYGKIAKERGIPIVFHNCGRCEDFMADYVDIGVKVWDPAQTSNDLLKVKEEFKGKLALAGCFDFVPDLRYNQITEDEVKQKVRDAFNKYAKGGGYAFLGGYLGRSDEMDIAAQINTWINEEVDSFGYNFYD